MGTRTHGSQLWLRRAALLTLVLWGLIHIVGGGALIAAASSDGGRSALELLGSGADDRTIPDDPGPVTQAVLGFHGFNLLLAGAGVLALALLGARTAWPRGVTTSLALIVAADGGLLIFLLLPGYMTLSDGLWGPLLLVGAAIFAWRAGWRPRQL